MRSVSDADIQLVGTTDWIGQVERAIKGKLPKTKRKADMMNTPKAAVVQALSNWEKVREYFKYTRQQVRSGFLSGLSLVPNDRLKELEDFMETYQKVADMQTRMMPVRKFSGH